MNVWTKICGITSVNDAVAAVEASADAIGVNFCAGSPRRCEPGVASEIVRAAGGEIDVYGVFAGVEAEEVARFVEHTGIGGVQLHGGEDDAFVARLRELVGPRLALIRMVAVSSRAAIISALESAAQGALEDTGAFRLLLDSPRGGGSGTRFDAQLLRGLDLSHAIVAGGLTPANVADVIAELKPYGVDTASGVERSPGMKDHAKIREFVKHAKRSAA